MRLLHLSWQDVAQSNKGRQSDIYFIFFSSSDCVSGFLLMFAKYDDDDGVWWNGLGVRKKGFLAINSTSSGNSIKTNIYKLYLFLSNRHVSNTHFKKCDDNSNFHQFPKRIEKVTEVITKFSCMRWTLFISFFWVYTWRTICVPWWADA